MGKNSKLRFKKTKKNIETIKKTDDVLKRKLKNLLRCTNLNEMVDVIDFHDGEENAGPSLEFYQTFEDNDDKPNKPDLLSVLKKQRKEKLKKSKVKSQSLPKSKPVIKSKVTEESENEMVSVISDILSNTKANLVTSEQSILASESTDLKHKSRNKNTKNRNFVSLPLEHDLNKRKKKKFCGENSPLRNEISTRILRSNKNEELINKKDKKSKKSCVKRELPRKEEMKKLKQIIDFETSNFDHEDVSEQEQDLCHIVLTPSPHNDDSSEDVMFDSNLDLARKVLDTINNRKKDNASENILDDVQPDSFDNIITNKKYSFRTPKKLNQEVSYTYSVLEVFNRDCDDLTIVDASNSDINSESCENESHNSDGDKTENEHNDITDYEMENKLPPENTQVEYPLEENIQSESPTESMQSLQNESSTITLSVPDQSGLFELSLEANLCIAILKHSTKLYFCGRLKASLLTGAVEVLGHKLSEKSSDIYSLSLSSLLCFEALNFDYVDDDLISKFRQFGISQSRAEKLVEKIDPTDSVIVLKPLNNYMIDLISRQFTTFEVFSKAKQYEEHSFDREICNFLQCNFYIENRSGLFSKDVVWDDIAKFVIKTSLNIDRNIVMICGGKNAGKSTYLRYLVNKTLVNGPVLVIDLDPGQPEFTVSGVLSAVIVAEPLLGTSFTHLRQPDKSLCLALIDVTENETRYMTSVQDLLEFCLQNEKYSKMPWIINTMGFTGKLGLKLITKVIKICKPTILVEAKSNATRNNFDINLTPLNVHTYEEFGNDNAENTPGAIHNYKYVALDPFQSRWDRNKPSVSKSTEAKHERMLNMLAYFSNISTASKSILDMIPFTISLDEIAMALNNISVDSSYVNCIINAKMVALCCDTKSNDNEEKIRHLGNNSLTCYGYGIVRGIDPIQKVLYLITPLNHKLLSNVNTLVYGESLPSCDALNAVDMPPNITLPYFAPLQDTEHKHLMQIPKRKFNPFRILEIRNRAQLK